MKSMDNIIICTLKSWNIEEAEKLRLKYQKKYNIYVVSEKEKLYDMVQKLKPIYIFFPHWSYIIPKEIYENYECVVFHMTDLPFGRGGSPLQNLIVRGIEETKISALRVVKEIDAGPIYFKKGLKLDGSAEEIFRRSSKIIFGQMIPEILEKQCIPKEQTGDIVSFERRKPEQSELKSDMPINVIYDYIRMLDAEGYPNAFVKWGNYKLKFTAASKKDGKITANVEIEENLNE